MFALLPTVLLAIAGTALAVPTPRQTSPGPWCDGLGGGVFDVASNFTLAALYRTRHNDNSTGVPLVLGQAGATDGAEYKVLSTWASYPYQDWPTLSLEHGGLLGNGALAGENRAIDFAVTSGSEPGFIVTGLDPPAPVQAYCAIADTDPAGGGTGFPWLAVNNDADSFSLCFNGYQNNIVYNATEDNYGVYIYSTCSPVTLQIVGLD